MQLRDRWLLSADGVKPTVSPEEVWLAMTTDPATLTRTWRLVDGFVPGVALGSVVRIELGDGLYRVVTAAGQMASLEMATTVTEALPDGRLLVHDRASDVRMVLEPSDEEIPPPAAGAPAVRPKMRTSTRSVLTIGCVVAAALAGFVLLYLIMFAINMSQFMEDTEMRASVEAQLEFSPVTYPSMACYRDDVEVPGGERLSGILVNFAVTATNGRGTPSEEIWLAVEAPPTGTNPVLVNADTTDFRVLYHDADWLILSGPPLNPGARREFRWTVLFQTMADLDGYYAAALEGPAPQPSPNYSVDPMYPVLHSMDIVLGSPLTTTNSYPARCADGSTQPATPPN